MTASMKNKILDALKVATTLLAADAKLVNLRPPLTQAMRWGLFDGFNGRLPSLAGLWKEADGQAPRAVVDDYSEGCEIGRELSMRALAG